MPEITRNDGMAYFHCDPQKICNNKNCKKELVKAVKIAKNLVNKNIIN